MCINPWLQLLRGAGCTVNDLWDRDLDSRVERTRTRPLAAGTLTPRQAVGEWAGTGKPPSPVVRLDL